MKDEKDPLWKKFFEELPLWVNCLCQFGEIGIVADQKNKTICAKLQDRGIPCMFVGYPEDHSGDVYKMYNWQTQSIIQSRNIIWLSKTYGEYKGILKTKKIWGPKLEEEEKEEIEVYKMKDHIWMIQIHVKQCMNSNEDEKWFMGTLF